MVSKRFTYEALLLAVIAAFLMIITSLEASATCTSMCNPQVSTPCGKGCISKWKSCHIPWTTACPGVRTSSSKPSYKTPKHVEPNSAEANGGKQQVFETQQSTDHAKDAPSEDGAQ